MGEDRGKFDQVMRDFEAGTLQTSHGTKVTNPAQARAIAHAVASPTQAKPPKPKVMPHIRARKRVR